MIKKLRNQPYPPKWEKEEKKEGKIKVSLCINN
jgi:hypothetical protein